MIKLVLPVNIDSSFGKQKKYVHQFHGDIYLFYIFYWA